MIAHTLRAEGFDASEDGTGRGTPLVAVAIQEDNQNGVTIRDTAGSLRSDAPGSQPCGTLVGVPFIVHSENSSAMREGGTAPAAFPAKVARSLDSTGGYSHNQGGTVVAQPLAFSCKDHGADAGETAPTLRAMNFDGSHANAGGQVAVAYAFDWQKGNDVTNPRPSTMNVTENVTPTLGTTRTPAVAFQERGREGGRNIETQADLAYSLNAPAGGGRRHEMNLVTPTMAVRRLTPLECERLMGFRDGYTAVPFRGKPASDGPRYRALGNSMVTNELNWIGRRIEAVEAVR